MTAQTFFSLVSCRRVPLERSRFRGLVGFALIVIAGTASVQASEGEPASEKTASTEDLREADNGWTELLADKNLEDWRIVEKWDFEKHGEIFFKNGILHFEAGNPFTGVQYNGEKSLPRMNYEIIFEAKRTSGEDFFIGVVFPVGEEYLSFVAGGWGGTVVGLTNLGGEPAVENESCALMDFQQDHWYTLRLRVSEKWIELWIEDEEESRKMIDIDHPRFQLSLYWEQEPLRPFGISSWRTGSAFRSVRFRELEPEELRKIEHLHQREKEKAKQRHHDYRPSVTGDSDN
jgi:hypothetical protein